MKLKSYLFSKRHNLCILFASVTLFFYNGAVSAEADLAEIKDKETIEIIKQASSLATNPNISAIMLLYDERLTIKNQKQAVLKQHILIKILREAGKDIGTIDIPFNEYFMDLRLNIARTIQPDGKIQQVLKDAIKDESPYIELPIYSDIKIKKIAFPQVRVGSVIEYEVEFIIDNKDLPGFSYMFTLPPGWTFSLVRFSAEAPKGTPVKFRAERFNNNEPTITSSGDKEQYTWHIKNTWSKGRDEIAVPNYMKYGQYVIFSTVESWQKINDWAIELMSGQCKSDKAIEQKTQELITGAKDDRQKIKAIFDYVSSQIRYVAIELGISAFKPYPASDVFENGYGDCKGKSALLIAMLKSIGIEAYPVLLMTQDAGFIIKDMPTFDFNHMIVAIPNEDGYMFLDPTAELYFDKVPYLEQGCDAFVVAKDKKEDFTYIPVDSPESNAVIRMSKIILKRDLSAVIKEDIIYDGHPDRIYRLFAKYSPPGQYKIKEVIKTVSSNADLKDLSFSDYNNLEMPFNIKYALNIDNFLRKSGDVFFCNVSLQNPFPYILFIKIPREAPLYLDYPYVQEEKVLIKIPQGHKIKTLPQDIALDKPFAFFSKKIKTEDRKITIETKWILKTNEISVGKSGAFKSMIEKIAKSNDEDIILEKETN